MAAQRLRSTVLAGDFVKQALELGDMLVADLSGLQRPLECFPIELRVGLRPHADIIHAHGPKRQKCKAGKHCDVNSGISGNR